MRKNDWNPARPSPATAAYGRRQVLKSLAGLAAAPLLARCAGAQPRPSGGNAAGGPAAGGHPRRRLGSLEVSALGLGCMNFAWLTARQRTARTRFARSGQPSSAASPSSTPPRCTARSSARRRSGRAVSRRGRPRHQVRLRRDAGRRAARAQQPAGAHPSGDRRFASAPEDRPDRSLLPAPRRPKRPDRGRRRCREEAHPRGEGSTLRAVGGGGRDHPPCSRRAAGHGRTERVLVLDARSRARGAAHV
jgi:hypothetical protein